MKITPACFSSFWKVVATDTELNTASTAILRSPSGRTTPSSTSTSRRGMPSFS